MRKPGPKSSRPAGLRRNSGSLARSLPCAKLVGRPENMCKRTRRARCVQNNPKEIELEFSEKGQRLIGLYTQMADHGYSRTDLVEVKEAFSDFELRFYRVAIKPVLEEYAVTTLLDYGAGGSDWEKAGFDESGQSARDYFNLQAVHRYEPARNIDQRQPVDCVLCFDVLEHIYIADINTVIHDLFKYAGKLLVINVACYSAAATLPNGENAHITVRNPHWWKGVVDSISIDYPEVSVLLLCSTGWRVTSKFPIWSVKKWNDSEPFVIND